MNVIKEYNTAKKKKGNVTFGAAAGGRWNFRASDKESGAWTKIMKVRGGAPIAAKIAEVISKSWLRTAGKKLDSAARLDAAARRAIDNLCQLRTLKDWDGETEWWTNALVAGQEAVKIIYVNQQKPTAPAGISPEDLGVPAMEVELIGELITA